MRVTAFLTILLFCLSARAQESRGAPVTLKRLSIEYHVSEAGVATSVWHQEMVAHNDAAAREIAQHPIRYSDGLHTVEILEAKTVKASGKEIPVDLKAILPQLVPGRPNVPMFNDHRQMVVIFPDVAAGDTLFLRYRRIGKVPFFPGEFMTSSVYGPSMTINEAVVSVDAPKAMQLISQEEGVQVDKRISGDRAIFTWRYSRPTPAKLDEGVLAASDRMPRFFVSEPVWNWRD